METIIFDAGDIDHLLNRFSMAELKHEAHNAEVEASVCNYFGEDQNAFFFSDYAGVCRLAIDILRSSLPGPKPIQLPSGEKLDIESIKATTDIVGVAERFTTLRKSGSRFNAKCPLHESKGYPLTIYPDNQSWYCFHCLKGGDVIDFVMTYANVDFKSAAGALV